MILRELGKKCSVWGQFPECLFITDFSDSPVLFLFSHVCMDAGRTEYLHPTLHALSQLWFYSKRRAGTIKLYISTFIARLWLVLFKSREFSLEPVTINYKTSIFFNFFFSFLRICTWILYSIFSKTTIELGLCWLSIAGYGVCS